MTPSGLETLARLCAAALLGGLLGIEREAKHKPAGLRTHMMVSLGAAGFTLAAFALATDALGQPELQGVRVDPVRIVQAVAGGIGFLGAGVILREAGSVHGLTTASSLWFVGAVGMAAGSGRFLLAAEAAVCAFVVLNVVGRLEQRFHPRRRRSDGAAPEDE